MLLRKILSRGLSVLRRFLSLYYRLRFRLYAGSLRSCHLTARPHFDVPVKVRGGGSLKIGKVRFGYYLAPKCGNGEIELQPRTIDSCISIGDGTVLANNVFVCANERIEIGANCLVGEQVQFFDANFHEVAPDKRNQCDPSAPVIIEDNVWIANRCMILKGVTIGRNSVVCAMSLVNKSIPPSSLVAGVPARVICSIKCLSKEN